MRRVISLFLPTWPTDRIRRNRRDAPPRDKPLVTALKEGSRRVIAAADRAAQKLGLRPGMTIAHAQAVVPDLTVLEADDGADREALKRLAAWCIRYSPLVAVDAPDGAWIEVAGSAHLFGGEQALIEDLTGRLQRNGVLARAAIADTPGCAWAVARFGSDPIVPTGRLVDAMASLPVAALRLPRETLKDLNGLGIERVGQVAGMPRAPLALRFGSEVNRRLDQALGHIAEPFDALIPPEVIRRNFAFAEPIGAPEDLQRVTGILTAYLCDDMMKAGVGARRLDLLFKRVDRSAEAVRIGTSRPTRDARRLARLLTDRLDTVDPGFGVEEAVLMATRVEPLAERQITAAELRREESEPEIDELVDRLSARLGPQNVYRCAPVESGTPERSIRKVPALSMSMALSWPAELPRPSRLFDPPEPVAATSMIPDNLPAFFIWRRVRHRIVRADGPERITGEWWKSETERSATRDYYQVENDKGERFWLFRDAPVEQGGRWWLHGVFA
jgi:protein ImuB